MKFKKLLIIIILSLISIILAAVDLSINSDEMQFISVSVTGAIKHPGVYKLNLDSRLSDAIRQANYTSPEQKQFVFMNEVRKENIEEKEKENKKNQATYSNRNITIYRGKEKINVDLLKFYKLGDLNNNPYLKDGDVIFVPAAKYFVYISGEVNSPGSYEIKQNEKLTDIIKLALGFKNSAFLDSIYVYRYKKDHIHFRRLVVNYKRKQGKRGNILLQDGDRIFIRTIPNYNSKWMAHLEGEVRFPGDYPLFKGSTTLLEILKKAGGITPYADLDNAVLIRISDIQSIIDDKEFNLLKSIPIGEMTYREYEYFKAKSRLIDGLVDVDFKKLWQTKDKKYDVILKDNDKIYIPNKVLTVEIFGQIKNPGKYTFVSGKNYFYYIDKAGGFSFRPNKKKIRIIKHKSGVWLKPKDTIIEPGDKIFIPEKPRYDYVKITKDFLQILTGAATLYFMRNSFK